MICDYGKAKIFQSTLPRGERPFKRSKEPENGNFNPRSRVGSDNEKKNDERATNISIHAPAWGATV